MLSCNKEGEEVKDIGGKHVEVVGICICSHEVGVVTCNGMEVVTYGGDNEVEVVSYTCK